MARILIIAACLCGSGASLFSQAQTTRAPQTIFSKVGDAYDEDAVRRDVMMLRNTNRFDEVRVFTEEGKKGGVVLRFVVTDRPPIQ